MGGSRAIARAVRACLASACIAVAGARAGDLELVRVPSDRALTIERSARVAPGIYRRPGVAANGVIVVDGLRDATIDLRGVLLVGAEGDDPARESWSGVGLWLRRCERVTVKGGSFEGFGTCVRVEDSSEITLEGIDARAFRSARLASSRAIRADADELAGPVGTSAARVGAAIELARCRDVRVHDGRARRGECGLVAVGCERLAIYDNDFSFLSGFGVALDSVADASIARNRVDFCVRGSNGPLWTGGQGSAGIHVGGASRAVRIVDNSAVRCGSGVVVRGEPKAPIADLWIERNDVSGALDDGIALAAVDSARIAENRARAPLRDGIALSFASDVTLIANELERCAGAGLSLRASTDVWVTGNVLAQNARGVSAVGDPKRPCRGLSIWENAWRGNASDLVLERAEALRPSANLFDGAGSELSIAVAAGVDVAAAAEQRARWRGVAGLLPSGRLDACSFESFDAEAASERVLELAARRPATPGVTHPRSTADATLEGELVLGPHGPWDFEGGETKPAVLGRSGLLANARWSATWFSWKGGPDPRGAAGALAAWRALAESSDQRGDVGVWTSPLGDGSQHPAVGDQAFGLIARTTLRLEPGSYLLSVTSDDGVRVSVDGASVLENWTWHGPTVDRATMRLDGGVHQFELEYFQVDGGMALSLELEQVASDPR